MCKFLLQLLSSIAQNLSVNKKDTSKLFKLVLIFFDCMKNSDMTASCVSMLFMTKQLVCKLDVLPPQPTVLSLLGSLSLDWNF